MQRSERQSPVPHNVTFLRPFHNKRVSSERATQIKDKIVTGVKLYRKLGPRDLMIGFVGNLLATKRIKYLQALNQSRQPVNEDIIIHSEDRFK